MEHKHATIPFDYKEFVKKEKVKLKLHGKINRLTERLAKKKNKIEVLELEIEGLTSELENTKELLKQTN